MAPKKKMITVIGSTGAGRPVPVRASSGAVADRTRGAARERLALLAAEADRLRTTPADAARLLRALALSLSHPHLVETPKPAREIVDLFLDGAMR